MVKYITGFFIIFILAGCNQSYYAPVTQNVPFFEEKGEARFSFNSVFTEESSTRFFGIMAAYALSDKHALQGNFFFDSYDSGSPGFFNFFQKHTTFEGGLAFGWYNTMDEESRVELFVGDNIGFKKINANGVDKPEYHLNSAYNKLYIQQSFGKGSKYFDFALTPALGYLYMFKFDLLDNNGKPMSFTKFPGESAIANNKHSLLFEPGVTLRLGIKEVKLQLQGVRSFNLSNKGLPYEKYSISFGLFVSPDFRSKE